MPDAGCVGPNPNRQGGPLGGEEKIEGYGLRPLDGTKDFWPVRIFVLSDAQFFRPSFRGGLILSGWGPRLERSQIFDTLLASNFMHRLSGVVGNSYFHEGSTLQISDQLIRPNHESR